MDIKLEKTPIVPPPEALLEHLISFGFIRRIYQSPNQFPGKIFTLMIEGKQERISQKILGPFQHVKQQYPHNRFRIYSLGYLKEQLEKGNLYFIRNCLLGKILYNTCLLEEIPGRDLKTRNLLIRSQRWFFREMKKINALKAGVFFYKKERIWNMAAFLLHQNLELLYRCLEKFLMGKSLICHNIANHQKYIAPFLPQWEKLFKEGEDPEKELLELLNIAYSDTRYRNDFHITEEEIERLLQKAEKLERKIVALFYSKLRECYECLELN